MIPEEYKSLVRKIASITEKKTLRWNTTSDEEKFILNVGLNSVTIHYYESFPNDIPTIAFEIRNMYGERIDGIYIQSEDSDYEEMWNLYKSARRNALKIEDTISDIMKELEYL